MVDLANGDHRPRLRGAGGGGRGDPLLASPAMTPEEFRDAGRAAIDWIADYVEGIERLPVAAPVVPGDVRAALPAAPPTEAEPFAAILRDVDDIVLPGLTHWQHPKFFAYFPSNTSYASILGDLLCAGLAVNGMSWATSPACTEVEA